MLPLASQITPVGCHGAPAFSHGCTPVRGMDQSLNLSIWSHRSCIHDHTWKVKTSSPPKFSVPLMADSPITWPLKEVWSGALTLSGQDEDRYGQRSFVFTVLAMKMMCSQGKRGLQRYRHQHGDENWRHISLFTEPEHTQLTLNTSMQSVHVHVCVRPTWKVVAQSESL